MVHMRHKVVDDLYKIGYMFSFGTMTFDMFDVILGCIVNYIIFFQNSCLWLEPKVPWILHRIYIGEDRCRIHRDYSHTIQFSAPVI